ncbi:MAG: hypothetical protein AAFR21_15215 [Pseudomonadota bacterium]
MSTDQNLALKEYEISKDNIKWVMGQLITVSGTLIAISVVVFRLVFDGDPQPIEQTSALTVMIIVLVNLVFAFLCYQNVQIIALQRHIHSLEVLLKETEIFRWESRIARIWYGDNSLTLLFNALVGLPALGLIGTLYVSLGMATAWPSWFWLLLLVNVAYVAALGYCVKKIAERIEAEIQIN